MDIFRVTFARFAAAADCSANLHIVKVTEANLTYVAIDSSGKPRTIVRD